MKKYLYLTAASLTGILGACAILLNHRLDWIPAQLHGGRENQQEQVHEFNGHPINETEMDDHSLTIALERLNGIDYLSLTDHLDELGLELKVDEQQGTVEVTKGSIRIHLIKDTPVLEKNGLFLPNEENILIENGRVFVPVSFLTEGMGYRVQEYGTSHLILEDPAAAVSAKGAENVSTPVQLSSLSAQELVEYLSFLQVPLDEAKVSSKPSHLPGAPRPYRNGVHEGIDWYSGTTGIEITDKTPVKSMADGVIVRADHNYVEYSPEDREADLSISAKTPHTPAYILDKLRGRSVWVQYDHGVMVRYAHLSRIEQGIKVGDRVKAGDIIGYVGNSGTSFGVEHSLEGLHLHSDILIYGELFWKYLKPEDLRYVLDHLFATSS